MTIKYPILFSITEPGILRSDYGKAWPMPCDVYLADYHQERSIEDDRLSPLNPVLATERRDQTGHRILPDGAMWLSIKRQICRLQEGKVVETLPALDTDMVAASASGDFVWAIEHGTDNLWQWSSKTQEWSTIWEGRNVGSLSSHPKENKVHFVVTDPSTGDETIREWDANRALGRDFQLPFRTQNVQFSPDSKVLAFVDFWDGEVKTYHLETGKTKQISDLAKESREASEGSSFHYGPRWSPDGRRLFYIYGAIDKRWEDFEPADSPDCPEGGGYHVDTYIHRLMVATPGGWKRKTLLDSAQGHAVNRVET